MNNPRTKTYFTNTRWIAEIRLMKNSFPDFKPYIRPELIGFIGTLQGANGRIYEVEIQSSPALYPLRAPKIFIRPHADSAHFYPDGSLSVCGPWRPNRDTFAQQVLYAANYLKQDG